MSKWGLRLGTPRCDATIIINNLGVPPMPSLEPALSGSRDPLQQASTHAISVSATPAHADSVLELLYSQKGIFTLVMIPRPT